MFKIIILLMYFINFMFMNFNNPLIMGILMFFQTLMMIMNMGKIYYSFWFSFIIFLVFIGGLFILFIYFISLTYNNKFFMLNYKYSYIMLFMMLNIYYFKNNFFLNEETNPFLNSKENMLNSLKFFNFPNNYINILLIIYLFIMMIIVVKITNFYKGPIKNLN